MEQVKRHAAVPVHDPPSATVLPVRIQEAKAAIAWEPAVPVAFPAEGQGVEMVGERGDKQ
jgi:hypothetical protein